MCKNGDPFWPGAYVGGKLNFPLLVQHFVDEKFGMSIDLAQAEKLYLELDRRAVPMSEPETRTALANMLGIADQSAPQTEDNAP